MAICLIFYCVPIVINKNQFIYLIQKRQYYTQKNTIANTFNSFISQLLEGNHPREHTVEEQKPNQIKP
jgi:hypothetical protein